MRYQKKSPEDFGPGDRVRINIEPGCDGAVKAHGYHHKLVNALIGTISWTQYPLGSAPDHIWRVEYDDGHFGWHKPSELVDYFYEVLTEAQAARST